MIALEERNILLDCDCETCEEAIRLAADRLRENGFIGTQYAEDVLAREKDYPTGLPTDDVPVALPHAFSSDVKETSVAVLRFKKPVAWHNMVMPTENVPVEMAFMLANASGAEDHLEELQELMNCFSREGLLLDMKKAATPAELIAVFENRESYPEI